MTKVLQVDREAAAKLAEWLTSVQTEWGEGSVWFTLNFPAKCRAGVWDQHEFVQAFATHREEVVRDLVSVTERLLSALSPLNIMGTPIANLDSALSEAIRDAVIAIAKHKEQM